ncbi:MAG: transketolase subunit [Firmicutes bacterium]|nr:transketolase subunit [Bacillota bacterium]
MEAAVELKHKYSVKVINVSTLKPMNKEAIIDMVKGCKAIVTAEEHSIVGGLGSAISEVLCKECKPIEYVGVNDTFGSSAHNYEDVLNYYGLTKDSIVKAIEKMANF